MNKATLKKYIPVWIDHNNEYHKIEGYLIHKDTGKVYSNKTKGRPPLRKSLVQNKYTRIYSYPDDKGYLKHKISNEIFSDLLLSRKEISVHRLLMISNVFHFNNLDKILKKAYKYLPEKDLKNAPLSIKKIMLRGLLINHKDHNKENCNYNNLEFCSAQENSNAYNKHRKKSL